MVGEELKKTGAGVGLNGLQWQRLMIYNREEEEGPKEDSRRPNV